jgi:hypothetical protein
MISIPSNIPYFNMLLLNIGQAVIAVFLASDFLRRDKRLDTSEIFYVRSLSNTEYVFGKIWGNIRVFIILNLISMGIVILLTLASPYPTVDLKAYIFYFFIISIPTLIYIIGLSVLLMLIFRNQAITFVLLLGYIGATIFLLKDKFYYLFDYMVYYLPLMKSTIVGFPNFREIVVHRLIYLFAGLTCILITIPLFGRLPNSSRSVYPWISLSLCTLLMCAGFGYGHVKRIINQNENRLLYTQINNKYVHTPKMVIEQYDISVKQNPASFASETRMTGIALSSSQVFTFCLNPGLEIADVRSGDKTLRFTREKQILLIDFDMEILAGDTVSLSVIYGGKLDNSFCYLDIPAEELNETNRKNLLSIDKQYSFQTKDYMLLTPETYWYPRPGTGFSNESPDWQQTYFSRFALEVTPLPGLIPVSQGEGQANDDGSYSFLPEYPVQAISLSTGKYRQKSCIRDSIRYSVWHIEGNDVFYATALDSIRDTIPAIIYKEKEDFEQLYKFDYPFKRFSIVEVPAQFQCYPHAWSRAQEAVQPEMVFFAERGCTQQFGMNIKKQVEDIYRSSTYNGEKISIQQAQMWALSGISYMFTNPFAYNYSTNRGGGNIMTEENRYFIYPQLFNFRYNIFSADWTVANRVIELYLQNNFSHVHVGGERDINGISKSEQANILLAQRTFKDLLADVKYRNLLSSIVAQKMSQLVAPAEINIGLGAFRDSLYSTLSDYTFRNVRLESLLDTLGKKSGADLLSILASWNDPVKLPRYSIGEPKVINVHYRGKDCFVVKIIISNDSDCNGIVNIRLDIDDYSPRNDRNIIIPARRSMQLVYVRENIPDNITINTMISGNLPQSVNIYSLPRFSRHETRKPYEKEEDVLLPEGCSDSAPDEVIVDNEDSTLFILSKSPVVGLLNKLLDKAGDTGFKYQGFNGNPRRAWVATTNEQFYGKYIRSAFFTRSVNRKGGDQTATWKIPVPSPGQYELYYHLARIYGWSSGDEYMFKVQYGDEVEDAYLNVPKAKDGWTQLGVYSFDSDTVSVTLSNELKKGWIVIADAVKIVKR